MGNNVSHQAAFNRLAATIPPVRDYGLDEYWGKEGKGTKVFRSHEERGQFIEGVLSVLSRNGDLPVGEYDFKLLYARNKEDKLIATLVGTKAGIIEAKIEPPDGGKDQAEAFKAFQKHVQYKLHELLQTVPDMLPLPGADLKKGAAMKEARASTSDAPPSYHDAEERI